MKRGFTLIELMIVIAIISILAAITIPNMLESRKHANEVSAIEGLKVIITTQSLFREADKEEDGEYDYGTLTEMADQDLLDSYLAIGTRQGYVYHTDAVTDVDTRNYVFYATANPLLPGDSGDKAFATNQEGVIFWTTQTTVPFGAMTSDAKIPSGMMPVR